MRIFATKKFNIRVVQKMEPFMLKEFFDLLAKGEESSTNMAPLSF